MDKAIIIIVITLLFSYSSIYSQSKIETVNKKIIELDNLNKELSYFIEDALVMLKRLNREKAIGEYTIEESFLTQAKATMITIQYLNTILQIIKATNDECYKSELADILNQGLYNINLNIDKSVASINVGLELDVRNNIINHGNDLKKLLRRIKANVTDWDE